MISIHGKDREPSWLGWFEDKVCLCSVFGYRKEDLTWPAEPNWSQPPICRHCGKWDRNRVFECAGCHQLFYRWFSHPRNGFYHNRQHNPVGWFCYSCCENAELTVYNMVPVNVQKRKVPPPSMVVPPNFVEVQKTELPSAVQSNLDDFLEKLKGLRCPNPSSEPS